MANMYEYNTSSAHKLNDNYRYSNPKTRNPETPAEVRRAPVRQTKKAELTKAQLVSRRVGRVLKTALCFAVAFIIINRYVAINEANSRINELKDEYNSVVAANEDLQAKIDKAVDLKTLQTVASEKFGMVRPERYQMFYIDMELDDFAENVAQNENEDEKEKVAVTGVPGTIIGAMKIFK